MKESDAFASEPRRLKCKCHRGADCTPASFAVKPIVAGKAKVFSHTKTDPQKARERGRNLGREGVKNFPNGADVSWKTCSTSAGVCLAQIDERFIKAEDYSILVAMSNRDRHIERKKPLHSLMLILAGFEKTQKHAAPVPRDEPAVCVHVERWRVRRIDR